MILTSQQVYDTDGNILQAVDDLLLPNLLTQLFSTLTSTSSTTLSSLTITELGAGTGRNTIKLLSPFFTIPISNINALDLSPEMLTVARHRCNKYLEANATSWRGVPEIKYYEFDALNPSAYPSIATKVDGKADIVLSTLVLEHLPIEIFFASVKSLLKKEGGFLLLTNMHAEMGRMSQAGFVDVETGEKIRGDSYNYEVEEVVKEGRKWGFSVVGRVGERVVKEEDVGTGRLLGPRGKKWFGVRVWFGMVMRFVG